MAQNKFRQVGQSRQIGAFGIESALLLPTHDLFLIVGGEDDGGEVVPVMRPCESIEETVVRIMNDRVFWVLREFRLEGFEESSTQSGLSIDFKVSSLSAEDLHSILGVASDMFCIHGPNGLSEVVQS